MKLSAKYTRTHQTAKPKRIAAHAKDIARTLPSDVSEQAVERFIRDATQAVTDYLDLLPGLPSALNAPMGKPRIRPHRRTAKQKQHPAKANRPADPHRHGLMGDLYDAYMTARASDDPDAVRGFRDAADAVLTAASLPPVTEREQRFIRDRIKQFARIAASP